MSASVSLKQRRLRQLITEEELRERDRLSLLETAATAAPTFLVMLLSFFPASVSLKQRRLRQPAAQEGTQHVEPPQSP